MGRAKKAKAAKLAAEPAWACFDQWSVDFPSERFLLSGRSCYQRHAEGRCSLVLDVCARTCGVCAHVSGGRPGMTLNATLAERSRSPEATLLNFEARDSLILLDGKRFDVRGVNWFGSEGDALLPLGLNLRSIDDILAFIAHQGFNAVRILFNHKARAGPHTPTGPTAPLTRPHAPLVPRLSPLGCARPTLSAINTRCSGGPGEQDLGLAPVRRHAQPRADGAHVPRDAAAHRTQGARRSLRVVAAFWLCAGRSTIARTPTHLCNLRRRQRISCSSWSRATACRRMRGRATVSGTRRRSPRPK